jgi:predicted ester cyclase
VATGRTEQEDNVPGFISDHPLARGLIRIGAEAIAQANEGQLRDYYADGYVLHTPAGDLDFEALRLFFASLRAAFTDFRIVREQIVADGVHLAARNTFSGTFTDVFTHSPIGPVQPHGRPISWEVMNTFRYNSDGRLAEEWVQSDYRGLLTKLGAESA